MSDTPKQDFYAQSLVERLGSVRYLASTGAEGEITMGRRRASGRHSVARMSTIMPPARRGEPSPALGPACQSPR
jgi:hypothetical protein